MTSGQSQWPVVQEAVPSMATAIPVGVGIVRRHPVMLAALFATIALLGVLIGALIPKKYSASTSILVEQSNIIGPLMEGRAVPTGVANRAAMAREVAFSRRVMNDILKTGGWLASHPNPVEQEQLIARRTQGRDHATLSDAQIENLKQVLSSKDPEAIRVAGRVLSNSWADYALRIGPDQQPVEPRAFMNAWLVLACEYGQPCGAETPRLQQACAMQGHCDAQNFPDFLYYYGSSPHDSQLLVQYRALLREAIETGNWSQLVVMRGLPPSGNRMNFLPGPR